MTQQERTMIASKWLIIAQMHSKEISTPIMQAMINAVQDLDAGKVIEFLDSWLATSTQMRHPMPAEIRNKLKPQLDSKDFAIELARKIEKAIMKHGWVWQEGYFHVDGNYWIAYVDGKEKYFRSFKEAVIAELGSIAWHAICARGSWIDLRNSFNEAPEGHFFPQLRDQIQSSYNLANQGIDVTQIEMPKKHKALEIDEPGDNHNVFNINRLGIKTKEM